MPLSLAQRHAETLVRVVPSQGGFDVLIGGARLHGPDQHPLAEALAGPIREHVALAMEGALAEAGAAWAAYRAGQRARERREPFLPRGGAPEAETAWIEGWNTIDRAAADAARIRQLEGELAEAQRTPPGRVVPIRQVRAVPRQGVAQAEPPQDIAEELGRIAGAEPPVVDKVAGYVEGCPTSSCRGCGAPTVETLDVCAEHASAEEMGGAVERVRCQLREHFGCEVPLGEDLGKGVGFCGHGFGGGI